MPVKLRKVAASLKEKRACGTYGTYTLRLCCTPPHLATAHSQPLSQWCTTSRWRPALLPCLHQQQRTSCMHTSPQPYSAQYYHSGQRPWSHKHCPQNVSRITHCNDLAEALVSFLPSFCPYFQLSSPYGIAQHNSTHTPRPAQLADQQSQRITSHKQHLPRH